MLVCGVDIGTTNLKVGLADDAGNLRQTATVATPRMRDDLGTVTAPLPLLHEIEKLVLQVWKQAADGTPITAICTTGVGEDGLLLDRDLNPLAPVIPWFDRRGSADAEHIRASAATTRAGIAMDPTRTGAKWRWLARQRADLTDRTLTWAALTDYPLIAWGPPPSSAKRWRRAPGATTRSRATGWTGFCAHVPRRRCRRSHVRGRSAGG